MQNADGSFTRETIALLNTIAIENPHEMYPLSRLAADLGRAGLVKVSLSVSSSPPHPAPSMKNQRWQIFITDLGWNHVTSPEALILRSRRDALKRLEGRVVDA
jgi:hypothetical protein